MNSNPHPGETRHLSFSTGVEGGFRDLTATLTHRICEHCGERKRAALDICTDPDHRCKEDR